MTKKKIAMFPGSFDPPTYGHMSIVLRALKVFDKVIIAIADNPKKAYMFSALQRHDFLSHMFPDEPRVDVRFVRKGLTAEFAKEHRVNVLLRGARTVSDFETEMVMATVNRDLNSSLDTFILVPELKYQFLSSTMLKEIVSKGKRIPDKYAPREVIEAMRREYSGRR